MKLAMSELLLANSAHRVFWLNVHCMNSAPLLWGEQDQLVWPQGGLFVAFQCEIGVNCWLLSFNLLACHFYKQICTSYRRGKNSKIYFELGPQVLCKNTGQPNLHDLSKLQASWLKICIQFYLVFTFTNTLAEIFFYTQSCGYEATVFVL